MEVPETGWHRSRANTRVLPLAKKRSRTTLAQPCWKQAKHTAAQIPILASPAWRTGGETVDTDSDVLYRHLDINGPKCGCRGSTRRALLEWEALLTGGTMSCASELSR